MYNPFKLSKKIKARPLDSRAIAVQKKTALVQQSKKTPRELLNNIQNSQEKLGFKTGNVLLQFAAEKIPAKIKNTEEVQVFLTELGIAAHAWNLCMYLKTSSNSIDVPAIPFFKNTYNM
ncbi:MAG: hypothetical protein RI894_685 [Bacteroidota bacterium]|jgi:hypothetical protein